jgi:hypothetical protein
MIGKLASAWGMESMGGAGKLVWAELPRHPRDVGVPPE